MNTKINHLKINPVIFYNNKNSQSWIHGDFKPISLWFEQISQALFPATKLTIGWVGVTVSGCLGYSNKKINGLIAPQSCSVFYLLKE